MKQVIKKVKSHDYKVPVYDITSEGLVSIGEIPLKIVKGSKNNEENDESKQKGIIVENLIELCIDHLMSVNQGILSTRDTLLAVDSLETALLRLEKRSKNRSKRNVITTYQQ
jgi:hypothetical protein